MLFGCGGIGNLKGGGKGECLVHPFSNFREKKRNNPPFVQQERFGEKRRVAYTHVLGKGKKRISLFAAVEN